jgi:outer membrane receptor protein involved in Fe transport
MVKRGLWLAGLATLGSPTAVLAQSEQPPAATPSVASPAPPTPAAASPTAAQIPPAKPAAKPPAKPAAKDKTVEEVTVTAAAPEEQTSIDKKSYALGKDLQATTGSIADALRNLPSVEVDLQGNLSIRGDQNVTILIDGKPSPALDGKNRADALQQLPADQIERVEVITNPSADQNPEGSGGVINLITKKSRGAGVTGSGYVSAGSAGLKRAGLNLGFNSPKLAVTMALSGNYQRNKQHYVDERDGLDPTSGQFLKNVDRGVDRGLSRSPTARINATFTPQDKDQFTAELSYVEQVQHDQPNDFYTDNGPNEQPGQVFDLAGRRRYLETDNGASLGWKHTFAEGETLSVDGVYNASIWRDHTLDTSTFTLPVGMTAPLELFRNDGNSHHQELRVAYTRNIAGGAFKAGYELRHEDNDYPFQVFEGPDPADLTAQPTLANHYLFHQSVNAVYATYQHGFGPLDLQLGLRAEDARFSLDQFVTGERDGQHYGRAYPSLHLNYKLDDDKKLTASYSERIQRPNSLLLDPLRVIDGPLDTQVGNPDLKPKETRSYEVGYEQHLAQQDLQATFYYRATKNDFAQLITDEGDGSFLYSFGNIGRSLAIGADLSASGKITSALSYSLSASPYWNQIDAGSLLTSLGKRSTYSGSGRLNLNWQADPKDLLQLNAVASGARLQAQGVVEPNFTLNAGWRHTLTDRLTATLSGQDLLGSNRFRRDLDTPALVEHLRVLPASRAVILRLDYRFGGGSSKTAKDPGFEYDNGPPPGAGPG